MIPKGKNSSKTEIIILSDDELEANEELIVELVGQFEDEESVSPQTLKVFDLEFQLDELISRRPEIEEEKAEAREERDGLQSIVREKTNIEQELLELGIITMNSGAHIIKPCPIPVLTWVVNIPDAEV